MIRTLQRRCDEGRKRTRVSAPPSHCPAPLTSDAAASYAPRSTVVVVVIPPIVTLTFALLVPLKAMVTVAVVDGMPAGALVIVA